MSCGGVRAFPGCFLYKFKMRILLINTPNCGRSIHEERYGITSLKQIFRGEPLALEELAGNLTEHEVRILDLKADPESLELELAEFAPQVVGITGVTCEANTILRIAAGVRETCPAVVVVGGIHASNDPAFFNQPVVDYVMVGIGKKVFADLQCCPAAQPGGDPDPGGQESAGGCGPTWPASGGCGLVPAPLFVTLLPGTAPATTGGYQLLHPGRSLVHQPDHQGQYRFRLLLHHA